MSYSYPEALDAMQQVAFDLLVVYAAKQFPGLTHEELLVRHPVHVKVLADALTGTASVVWHKNHYDGLDVTIRMPVRPAHARMSEQEFQNYAGFILHEVGHPLFTDNLTWQKACREGFQNITNALEDVREERLTIEANFAVNAKDVLTDLCHQLDYTAMQKGFDANDPRNIGFVMGFLGRVQNGYDLDPRLLKLDPNGVVAKALKWALPELAAAASTEDCLQLGKKLLNALPKKDPAKNKPKGNRPGEGQKGEGQKGEGQKGEGQKGEGQKGEGQGAGVQPEGLADKDVRPVELRPVAGDELEDRSRLNAPATQMAAVINAIRSSNRTAGVELPKAVQTVNQGNVDQIGSEALKASRQRALLARAMKRNEQDLYEGGLKHGKLDRRAYARLEAGARNVFGRRELTEGYDTDCVVLVDGSGSMGSRIEAASTMALVIAQAAAQVGVSCTTYIFGTGHGGYRTHGLVEVKEGRSKPDAAKFANMIDIYGGGTPLSPSMLVVAGRQVKRAPNKRRVMFVVSDGMCQQGPETLKAVADYIEVTYRTELAHMSIHVDARGCFRNEVTVKRGDSIASVGLEKLTKTLERGL